jgi:hypothetical protein
MKNGRLTLGASALSVMLASFLTVAVSSLYIMTPVAREFSVNLTRVDRFSPPRSVFLFTNESTARTSRLATYGKLDDLVGSHGSYVIPAMSLPQSGLDSLKLTSMKVQIPVQRGTLK